MEWRKNLGPSVVVLLISIPLSMGIAIASGAPPARGLVTAVIGGVVIGALAGSPLQISGPSAGLAVMVLDIINQHGLRALAIVVPLMGLIQIGAGLLRLGQIFRAVSPAVINGMLAGIGVLIFSAQFHVMVDDNPKGSGLENLLTIPMAIYKGLVPLDGSAHHWAALIGVITMAVLVGTAAFKKGPLSKVPPPLAAVVVATAVVWGFDVPVQRIDMPASLLEAIAPVTPEAFGMLASPALLVSAVALAFVASAETLLCATAVDAMHDGPRTNYDRELFAQGVGNTVCGLLGALPTTGVITRSTANVQAGATTRASTLLYGTWLLLILALFPTVFSVIPRSSLAALLVYIGYKLVRTRPLEELRWYGRSELVIFFVTVATIVGVTLLTGIVVGLVLAAAKLIYSQGKGFHSLGVEEVHDSEKGQVHLHLRGAASFIRLPRLAATLESMPKDHEVHLHVEELDYIDHACLDLLSRWERDRMRARAPVRVQWKTLHHRYHTSNPLDATPEEHAELPPRHEHLLDFLAPEAILIEPPFTDKWQAIQGLSRHLAVVHRIDNPDGLIASVTAREHETSTCFGEGLMIPHGSLPRGSALVGVMALSSRGWPFDTPDGKPVHCIVLLATPEGEASRHLAVLAAFARLFTREPELRDQLIGARTPEDAWKLLNSERAATINYAFESADK